MAISVVSSFFDNLSARMRKENDLSDITWALCQTSSLFFEWFIHFFFKEIKDIKSITEFTREYPDEQGKGCRVDFFIRVRNEKSPYIIENKIGDQNQHFGDYDDAYRLSDKDHFGYIANYPYSKKGYNRIKQWSELYDQLSKDIDSFPEGDKLLIEAYLSYVKSVCNIIKFNKKMNLQNLYSMFELFQTLKELTNRATNDYTISLYGNNETMNGANFKFWFIINYTNPTISIPEDFGVIGFWYNREVPVFSIGFDRREGWGKRIYSILKAMDSQNLFQEYQYCCRPYDGEGSMWIDIKEDVMKRIDDLSTIDEQIEVIRNFMDEALRIPLGK